MCLSHGASNTPTVRDVIQHRGSFFASTFAHRIDEHGNLQWGFLSGDCNVIVPVDQGSLSASYSVQLIQCNFAAFNRLRRSIESIETT